MLMLYRKYHMHCTTGLITLPDDTKIHTLELPWMDNAIGYSCIPEGEYIVDRDYTGKHRWYRFRDKEVYPRSAIEIHPASYLHHLQGCIAPCMRLEGEGVYTQAVESKEACELLVRWYSDESIHLRIVQDRRGRE